MVSNIQLPQLADGEASVKGDVIYSPKGQALEYSALACNPYRGCGHKCAYCYVPLVTKQPRLEFDAGGVTKFIISYYADEMARAERLRKLAKQLVKSRLSHSDCPICTGALH